MLFVNFKYLIYKYSRYVEWWTIEHGSKDPKYVANKDKMQNAYDWLSTQGFNQFYKHSKTQTDEYIFGGFTEETLKRKLNIFLKLVGKKPLEVNEQEEDDQEPSLEGSDTRGSEDPF